MVHNKKLIITESERRRISNLHHTSVSLDYVISDWLSPDEKYAIFLDELYDIENKTKLGNIWENFDNFKFFMKHSFEVATNVPQSIKESVFENLDSFVLTESTQNLTQLKPIFKQILNEGDWGLLGDLGTWAKDTVVGAAQSVTDFAKTSYEGIKKLGIAIGQGDWTRVLDLIKKGSLYVARKIRAAMYHPIGLILDAILVASQLGKALAWIPWAVAVGLDVYEFISGNYEDPELHWGWRLLFVACDILGLVVAGAAAKGPRTIVLGLIQKFGKTFESLKAAIKSSPAITSILKKVGGGLSKVESMMKQAQNYTKTKSPMFYKFFSGIMGGIGKLIGKLTGFIQSVIGGTVNLAVKGGKAAVNVLNAPGKLATKLGAGTKTAAAANILVPAAVIGTGVENYKRRQTEKGMEQEKKVEDALKTGPESVYDSKKM